MPGDPDLDGADADEGAKLSLSERLARGRARRSYDAQTMTSGERMRNAFLKPPKPESSSTATPAAKRTLAELEAEDKHANDKERLIGLIAAPIAAALGILVISTLITNDPPAELKNGQVNKLHVNVSTYHDLIIVLLGISVVMLVTAMLRKRLYLGIAMALYGLTLFNLHFWGFGVPFIMCAAWLMVRAYRLHRDWREAGGDVSASSGKAALPPPNKRYTRPSSSPSRAPRRAD